MSYLNKFFDKIFVINLFDKVERWKEVNDQLVRRKIKADRFIAIDGRCKNQGKQACLEKLKTFEMAYDVKIKVPKGYTLQEMVPASSLTIGTILILREMVRKKWKNILILEDDVEVGYGLESKFKKGIKSLPKDQRDWDILYLGCGNSCGHKDVSAEKTSRTNKISTINQKLEEYDDPIYVMYKNDLRTPCPFPAWDIDLECPSVSEYISEAPSPGGTWAYAVSLKGAKKILKLIGKDAATHIDQVYKDGCQYGDLKCFGFDPPLIWHKDGYFRADTDIPWQG